MRRLLMQLQSGVVSLHDLVNCDRTLVWLADGLLARDWCATTTPRRLFELLR